jgi:hypothetical protein
MSLLFAVFSAFHFTFAAVLSGGIRLALFAAVLCIRLRIELLQFSRPLVA